MAHDGDGFAGLDDEAHIAQNPVGLTGFGIRWSDGRPRPSSRWAGQKLALILAKGPPASIGEPYVIELDSPRTVGRLGDRRRSDFHRCIEQFENAFAGRHRGLQNVVLLAEILNRTEETLRI